MPTSRSLVFVAIAATALFFSTPTFAEKVSRGSILSGSCFSCHGPDGHSPGSIPSLAGKPADYIQKALKDFASGARPSTVMGRHAKGYTDEEIEIIAKYLAGK